MKLIYLLRHGAAARPGLVGGDASRPLAPEGRGEIAALARQLRQMELFPAHVACSDARRARESWEILEASRAESGAPPADIEFRGDLYLADLGRLLALLRALPQDLCSVLLVGHNPGLQNLALLLAGADRDATRTRPLSAGLPTGALVVFALESETWSCLPQCELRLLHYIRPGQVD